MSARRGGSNQQRSAHQRILVCKKEGHWQDAVNILTDMREYGRNLGTVSYNAAIDACGKAKQVGRALELFDELVAAGNVPDAVTYTALIDACGRAGLLDQAFTLFGRSGRAASKNSLLRICSSMACAYAQPLRSRLPAVQPLHPAPATFQPTTLRAAHASAFPSPLPPLL